MNKKIIHILCGTILGASLILNVLLITDNNRNIIANESFTECPTECPTDTLNSWEVFTLALMKVESNYDNDAVSSAGAKGYFQMTPIYVKEVNRIHNTDFTFEQVTDFDTAYQIFDLMQQAHNPNYDMDRALEIHNGKHKWYSKRVYKEMDNIVRYESMRKRLKNTDKI